jgi:hypothetical protein
MVKSVLHWPGQINTASMALNLNVMTLLVQVLVYTAVCQMVQQVVDELLIRRLSKSAIVP